MNSVRMKYWRKTTAVIFGAFTVYVLFCVLQAALRNLHSPPTKPWTETLTLQIVWGYTWAAITPFIIAVSNRFTISRQYLVRHLVILAWFGVAFAFVHRTLYIAFVFLLSPTALTVPDAAFARVFYFLYIASESFLDYLFILAIYQAFVFYQNYQAERLKAALLQSSLSEAQLQVLNSQLNPHFLFNTLNAIAALVYHNQAAAVDCLVELSDLLRISLKSSQNQKIVLRAELDFLRKYVQIQQTLLQERLQVKWNIAPETLDAEIPCMILQPLVENSIRHGISPLKRGGTLEITVFSNHPELHLIVSDNGRGFADDAQLNNGVGLKNTQDRLNYLYRNHHEFKINKTTEGGVTVEMTIPFKKWEAPAK